MCFSATASFTASAVLFAAGAVAFRQADGFPNQFLSIIPFLFAVQQGFEGLVWLGLDGVVNAFVQQGAAYGFLTFAVSGWPLIFALAAYQVETVLWRQNVMQYVVGIGVLWAIISHAVLLASSVSPSAQGGHILYNVVTLPSWFVIPATILYTLIGVVPLFMSSEKELRVLGAMILASGVVTKVLEATHFVSVWCFWAALISGYIAYTVYATDTA
jgi:hypothetical protein